MFKKKREIDTTENIDFINHMTSNITDQLNHLNINNDMTNILNKLSTQIDILNDTITIHIKDINNKLEKLETKLNKHIKEVDNKNYIIEDMVEDISKLKKDINLLDFYNDKNY
jgi:chromosome segregation ATPase